MSSKIYSFVQWEQEGKISLDTLFKEREKTLIYFYPRDNTPGCTVEARDFTCLEKEFQKLWIGLIGVSQDSITSHKKFIADHQISFPLISDEALELHKQFWAYGEKNNYWKIIQGVIRSTFLIDSTWNILKAWRNVKATGHAEKILKELQK
jgi:thioredoxin-dependent peroxiredoxin